MSKPVKTAIYLAFLTGIAIATQWCLNKAYYSFLGSKPPPNDNYFGLFIVMALSLAPVAAAVLLAKSSARIFFALILPLIICVIYSINLGHYVLPGVALLLAYLMFRAEFGGRIDKVGLKNMFNEDAIDAWDKKNYEEMAKNSKGAPMASNFNYEAPPPYSSSSPTYENKYLSGGQSVGVRHDGYSYVDQNGQRYDHDPLGGVKKHR